jgi:glyoxylase-like metal-dependent hydrolase (beta-lactamase superfamily II)
MRVVELRPGELYLLGAPLGQCYLWRDGDSATLIDTGVRGSGPAIAQALRAIGLAPAALTRVVLTHFHDDHAGSAAEVGEWGQVSVLAHTLDAPIIRGDQPGPPPNFTDDEIVLHQRVASGLPPAPPARVDRELTDGDVLDFGGGATSSSASMWNDVIAPARRPAHCEPRHQHSHVAR